MRHLKEPASGSQLSPRELDQVRKHLDKLLTSEPFAHSSRSQSFLKYVVEETLAGRSAHIKERNIAVDVFGKSIDFDPQEQSVVRVGASDVRKRLLAAYQNGFPDGVRIDLPVGSYCPRFDILTPIERDISPVPEAIPSPQPIPSPLPSGTAQDSRVHRFVIVGAFIGLLFAAVWSLHRPSALDCVWSAFSGQRHPVLVVLPTPPILQVRHPEKLATANSRQPVSYDELVYSTGGFTGVGAGLGAARFAEQLARRNQQFVVRSSKESTFADVQQAPAILFGSTSSEIGMQLTSTLPFHIAEDTTASYIRDTHDPSRFWSVPRNTPIPGKRDGYALITFLRKTESGYPMLVVAGLSPADTLAAAQFITDNASLEQWIHSVDSSWRIHSFQIVLHEVIYEGSPSRSDVAASHIW